MIGPEQLTLDGNAVPHEQVVRGPSHSRMLRRQPREMVVPVDYRALVRALDGAGIEPGDAFYVSRVPPIRHDENRAGPHVKGSRTSRDAALANAPRSGTQRATILSYVCGTSDRGVTRDELVALTGFRYSSVGPRVLELIRGGFIVETDRVRKTVSGNDAVVLVATEKGRAA